MSSLALLFKKSKNGNHLIGFSLFFFTLFFLAHYLLYEAKYVLEFPHLMRISSPLMFLTAPAFFLYIRGAIKPEISLGKKDIIHALPAVVHFIELISFYSLSGAEKIEIAQLILEKRVFASYYAKGLISGFWIEV